MTTPSALERPTGVPVARRLAARLVLLPAVALALLPPRHIRSVLGVLRRGAAPATARQALNARDAMCAASLYCAGPKGCLPRSLGAALLCRLGGTWPTWCTGVRVVPPFTAHAWIEAEGRPVGEGVPEGTSPGWWPSRPRLARRTDDRRDAHGRRSGHGRRPS